MNPGDGGVSGTILAEFDDPECLVEAIRRLRAEGEVVVDAYTPCPVEGLEDVLEIERTRIPWIALAAGALAGAAAYGIQWWISVVAYPLDVGGRPLHSAPTFVPITFEMAILGAAIAAFAAFVVAGGMPRLWHPVFEVDGFERATVDRYWLAVRDRQLAGEIPDLVERLESLGALRVVPGSGTAGQGAP